MNCESVLHEVFNKDERCFLQEVHNALAQLDSSRENLVWGAEESSTNSSGQLGFLLPEPSLHIPTVGVVDENSQVGVTEDQCLWVQQVPVSPPYQKIAIKGRGRWTPTMRVPILD
ncbi:uncharacterized protein LOC112086096 [Eutrema salsugineum]|uniref:uncharacterized protein LOC112086096 n=1 Tax=Eutrema salsugineum TaxID=72664 RepID=UPI000CED625A|nr:uncharacterized protein LOC112086096 [Eutrema salsugineum]